MARSALKGGIIFLPYSRSWSIPIPGTSHTRSIGFSRVQSPSPGLEKGEGLLERLPIQKGDRTEYHAEADGAYQVSNNSLQLFSYSLVWS